MVTNPSSTAKRKSYQAAVKTCQSCVLLVRCSSAKKKGGREIRTDKHEPARQAMNQKMESGSAKEIYARRKVIVEPAFGHIKNSGFRGFSLRGKEKVAGEFSLVCAAYNFKKIVRKVLAGLIRLYEAQRA